MSDPRFRTEEAVADEVARREREQDDRQDRDDEAAAFQRERMRDEINEGRAEQRQAERDFWAYC